MQWKQVGRMRGEWAVRECARSRQGRGGEVPLASVASEERRDAVRLDSGWVTETGRAI